VTSLLLLALAGVTTGAGGSSGPAEPPTVAARSSEEDPVVISNRLFDAAKASEAAGDVASACEAFDRSYALVPRIGTLLNLGLCHEQQGRFLLAREALHEAVRLLTRGGGRRDRLEIATAHLRTVEAALSWLDFELPPLSSTAPIEVRVDEAPVDLTKGPVPVETGDHRIKVTATGYLPRTIELSIGPAPERRIVRVERLVPVPAAEREPVANAAAPATGASLEAATPSTRAGSSASAATAPGSLRAAPVSRRQAPARTWLWVGGGVAVAAAAALAVVLLIGARSPQYPSSTVSERYP